MGSEKGFMEATKLVMRGCHHVNIESFFPQGLCTRPCVFLVGVGEAVGLMVYMRPIDNGLHSTGLPSPKFF